MKVTYRCNIDRSPLYIGLCNLYHRHRLWPTAHDTFKQNLLTSIGTCDIQIWNPKFILKSADDKNLENLQTLSEWIEISRQARDQGQ